MIGALFCSDDKQRKELVSKIRQQFDEVLSIQEINERKIQEILRTNKTALIECRSHRQLPHEISHFMEPVIIAQGKKAIISDNYSVFAMPLDKLGHIDIAFGNYEVYRRRYDDKNPLRRLFRRLRGSHMPMPIGMRSDAEP